MLEVDKMNHVRSRMPGCLLAAVVLAALPASDAGAQNFRVSLAFDRGTPQGTLAENVAGPLYGFSIAFAARPWRVPLEVGTRLGFHFYGSDSFPVPLSAPFSNVFVNASTYQGHITTHLVARTQPTSGRVQPYLEAAFGLTHMFCTTSLEADHADEAIAGVTHEADSVVGGGVSGGVEITLVEGSAEGRHGGHPRLSLDASVRRFWSGRARYVKEGSLATPEAFERPLEIQTSPFDLLNFSFGLAFRF